MTTIEEAGVRPPAAEQERPGRVVFTAGEIRHRVAELAREVEAHYPAGEPLTVLGLLKGSFIFLSDLVREMRRPLQIEFLVASSYGAAKRSSGSLAIHYDPRTDLAGRHLLLIEDIIDSGTTLSELIPRLREQAPASIEVCALLHKRLVRLDEEPRFVGFSAPAEFLVGYGLDHAGEFRHLPYIASLS